jgi:ATP-dependent Clp protease ATP-binding subunit ClpA
MRLDEVLNRVITAAYNEARTRKHEYFTPEHVLYSMLFFDDGKDIIEGCGGDVEQIKFELNRYFNEYLQVTDSEEITESVALQRIIQAAGIQVLSSEREVISIADMLVAIYDQEETFASYFIRKQGISKIDLLNYISHGITKSDFEKIENEFDAPQEDNIVKEKTQKKEDIVENYCIDLTRKAIEGEVDPLIGREEILQRTIQVLCRRTKNNPIHVGEPGVGKTAITEGLAQLIVQNKVPELLQGSKIYYLDMGSMLAGTKYRGDFEERMKKVLQEIQGRKKAIVYIDEIHTVVGAGSVSGGAMDASNILKPFLSKGKLRVIGSTTYDEYKKFFDKDKALSRRFQKIEIAEPTVEETYKILLGLKGKYEEFHKVEYSDSALKMAAELSAKYIQDRQLPDKAIDVIDESGAYARLNCNMKGERITITEKHIEKTVSLMAKIPEQSVSSNETEKLKKLDYLLKQEIFGQDRAIDMLVKAIKRSRAGFNEGEKPVASLLFVGPTGVGKTEVAKQLSSIFGITMLRFDMSEYAEKHTVAKLIGSPPGYVGYEEGGLLTDAVRKTPYCVLLLDEIEKAHSDIFNILLQIMDYATLTDNNGKKADFRNVIIIMTSNAGAREVGKTLIGFNERYLDEGAIIKEVERLFSPEFRNRLDGVVRFNHIDEDMALKIAKKAIKKFEEKLSTKNIKLKVTDRCYKWLADKGFSSKYGAREILRTVQEDIKTYFVDEVLFGSLADGGEALIDVVEDKIIISKE